MFVVVWRSDSPKADEHAKRRANADARVSDAATFAAARTESTNPFETDGGVNHKHALASVVLRYGHRLRERVCELLCATDGFAVCVAHPEADHGFPFLARAGIVQGVISRDTDMSVHLGDIDGVLWLNKHPHFPTAVQPKAVVQSLFPGVPNAFLWMFCLIGCDYTNGVKRFGYATSKRALQALSKKVLTGNINFGDLPVRLHAL